MAGHMTGMNHGSMMGATAAPMQMNTPYLNTGRAATTAFKADIDIALTAKSAEINILSGKATQVWRYEAQVLAGDPTQVQTLASSYLGPILRVRRGQNVRIRFTNQLPSGTPSTVHWHGLRIAADMDGQPDYVVAPGKTYVYEFGVTDRAMTAWFHPHPHGETAHQVYMGMAGMLIVNDDEEQKLGLPSGEYDLPLVLQDRAFDKDNQLVYLSAGMMAMMDQMMGFYGDQILVNGKPNYTQEVATRAYRLRILNGSNARIYKLALSDGSPLTVIGTDNGLLEKPIQRKYVMLSPGERVELWLDFAGRAVGDSIKLISQKFEGAENVGGGGMMSQMHASGLAQGDAFDVMTFKVARASSERLTLPAALVALPAPKLSDASNAAAPREFAVNLRQMQWSFNGRVWGDDIADNERVKQGSTEVWSFVNALNPGEMMDAMGMAHPIHLHGVHYKILERELYVPELKAGYDSVREGYINEGLKDTFLLMPGERVKVLVNFAQPKGKYIYHCHNLEHEDQGLMRRYEVI
jgi:FtsP/CotA-like multicopper oxidase with cupredoxin domain